MSRSDCCACTLWRRASARLQKEMATYRQWSVSLWRDPDDVPHCRILFPDKTEWRLISATLCGRCFMADQLWFMTRIREEEDGMSRPSVSLSSVVSNFVAPYAKTWTFRQYFCTVYSLGKRTVLIQLIENVATQKLRSHLVSFSRC